MLDLCQLLLHLTAVTTFRGIAPSHYCAILQDGSKGTARRMNLVDLLQLFPHRTAVPAILRIAPRHSPATAHIKCECLGSGRQLHPLHDRLHGVPISHARPKQRCVQVQRSPVRCQLQKLPLEWRCGASRSCRTVPEAKFPKGHHAAAAARQMDVHGTAAFAASGAAHEMATHMALGDLETGP